MRQASVGFHCPECTKEGAQKVVRGPAAFGVARPVLTQLLIAANVAVFGYGLARGGDLQGNGPLLFDGSLVPALVADGEWYRIITSGFLHAGPIHVGFNMWVLYTLGSMLEPALGWVRFGAVYLVALMAGGLGVIVLDPGGITPTVGASGAVFGIMGAAVLAQRMRGVDPFATGLGGLLVINLILTFAIPRISIGGHIGGLAGGLLAGWILLDLGPRLTRSNVVPELLCVAVAAGLFAGSIAIAQPF